MAFYVYIIRSEADSSYYKGYSEYPLLRLHQHNAGECVSTRHKIPWKLVYLEKLETKREALIRERALKKLFSRERLPALGGDARAYIRT